MSCPVEPPRAADPLPIRLGPYDGPTTAEGRRDEAALLATARTTIHPQYRRSPGDCLTLLYRAHALNIPVGVAIDNIYIEGGRGGLTAQLMAALLLRAGIKWTTVRNDDQETVLRFREGRKTIGTVRWHIREAVAAGLTRNDVWRQYPADSLWARAIARGCRRHFSHLVMGMSYTPEEIREIAAGNEIAEDTTDPRVRDLLDRADTATADTIRLELIPEAKRRRLAKLQLPDGQTCEHALAERWQTRTALETAAQADAATATAEPVGDLNAPAGTGTLGCGCPAATVLSGQPHERGCTHVMQ